MYLEDSTIKILTIYTRLPMDFFSHQSLILNSVHDAVIGLDPKGIIHFWNIAAEDLFGWKAEEVIGLPGRQVVQAEIPDVQHKEILGVIDQQGYYETEGIGHHKNGRKIVLQVKAVMLKDLAGVIEGYVLTIQDQTSEKILYAVLASEKKHLRALANKFEQAAIQSQKNLAEAQKREAQLRESEERYQVMFQNRHSPMLLIDPNTAQIIDANPAACAFYGWSLEALTAMKITDINQLPVDQVILKMKEAQSSQTSKSFNFRHRLAGGNVRDVEVHSGPIQINQKVMIFSIINDITERIQAEQALRDSQARMVDFLESTHDSFIALDRDWRFVYANHRYTEIVGRETADLIGKNFWDEMPLYRGTIVEQNYHKAMKERVPVHFEYSGLYSQNWYDISIYPTQEGISIFSKDRTVEKKSELALRQSESRLRHLFDTSIIGILQRDTDGNISAANDAFLSMLGYTRSEFVTEIRNIHEILPEEYEPLEREIINEVVTSGASQPHEKEFIRRDGSRLPILVGHTMLDQSQKEIFSFVVNLSELKETQASLQEYTEKLKRSNHELEQFAFVASHDLQEPLRKIKLFGSLLTKRLNGKLPEDAADHLNRMLSASERMQLMINGLLDLSRVNTRSGDFQYMNLKQTAEEAISDLESRIESAGGEVVIVDDLPTIQADEDQIRRLLQNLIGNGLKFHRPNVPPRITLTAALIRGERIPHVEMIVEDNGIGFEEEYAQQIFKPFQRLNGRSEFEGTGMGLAICQRIAERHGGTIQAHSVVGKGSRFIVTLPLMQGE